MHTNIDRGVIDALARLLAAAFKKPAFKDGLHEVLANLDPQNSPQLVRTLLWQDVEVALGLCGALPALANIVIAAVDELATQLDDKFSPTLLDGFIASLIEDIDLETLAAARPRLEALYHRLQPLFKTAWEQAGAQRPRTIQGGLREEES